MEHLCIIVSPCKSQYKVTPAGWHSMLKGLCIYRVKPVKPQEVQNIINLTYIDTSVPPGEVQARPCKMELEELQNIVWRIL